MRKIYLTGDTHGDLKRFGTKNFPEQKEMTKEDIVFQLGDFGVIWGPQSINEEIYWMEWLADKPWTTIVVAGNHENWEKIESLPETELFSGKMWEYETQNGSVYFVKPGEILEIDDKKFLCIPKATSIDKMDRTEGRSWWPGEVLSYEQEKNTMDNLDGVDWKVDYVLSHTCPVTVIGSVIHQTVYTEGKFACPVSKFLDFIEEDLIFDAWWFGHFHTEAFSDMDPKFRCLYFTLDTLENLLEQKEKVERMIDEQDE